MYNKTISDVLHEILYQIVFVLPTREYIFNIIKEVAAFIIAGCLLHLLKLPVS